jgi:bifunctional DNase/RNase
MFPGIYKFDAHRMQATGVFTNKTPTDAYRGAGRPEATFAIERAMDDLAAELDMDPLELRRKNCITHDEFPFATVTGLTYDSGNYEAATDKAMRLLGYDELRREQEGQRYLPITIGSTEAFAIAVELEGIAPPRPLTHDLLREVIEELGARVDHVVITQLRGGTFFAELVIIRNGDAVAMDARPSDAIALALRANAAIYATESLLDQAGLLLEPEREEPALDLALLTAGPVGSEQGNA